MKIKSMTATFGKLDRARLEPGPGLTLIHAPNEGGKSTWAAFWRAMLYGIDTRDRDRKGYLADKNRYQPWSGAPMEGEIALELEGREITIRRGPRGNTPFGSFSAVYTGTQEPVPGLTASNCGELLTGVGQEVFTRSAFLGDGNLALTTAPELERRIAALVSSGQEDVSFSQAMERLKGWKNRRQVNRSVGDIPRLEGELTRVADAMNRMEEAAALAVLLEGERAALERRRDGLAQEMEVHRAIARKKLTDRYVQAEEEHRAAQEQLSGLEREQARFGAIPDREELKRAQGELQYIKVLDEEIKRGTAALEESQSSAAKAKEAAKDDRFAGLSGEEAVAKAAEISASVQTGKEKLDRQKKMSPKLAAAGLILAALFGGGGWFANNNIMFSAGLALIVCAGTAGSILITHLSARKAGKQIDSVLSPFGVRMPEELTALAQNYRDRCQKADRAAHEVEVIRNAVTERQDKRNSGRVQLLDFVHGFAPEVKDLFGCSAALSRALSLEHDLSLARERVEERRRRLEDLEAQGVKAEDPAAGLQAPERGPEETARFFAQTTGRLDQVSAQLNQARGTLQAMGEPAVLSARKEELEYALARKRLELDALTAAMDALTQANARLQERFSPDLNRLAGDYMARLTGDKYAAVSLTRELEGFVQTGEGVLPHSALCLSKGTADQLYLAVRLAVCRLCLPEKPPILLDDALSAFDDQRLTAALELLWELSGEQQLLLFTCQKREGEALGHTPGVTRIEL